MSIPSAFRIEGELSIYRAAELRQALQAWAPGAALTHGCIALELGEVSDMDSAGLQLLLSAQRSAQEFDVPFQLLSASKAVADVLRISALLQLMPPAPGLSEAHQAPCI